MRFLEMTETLSAEPNFSSFGITLGIIAVVVFGTIVLFGGED